MQKKQNKLLVIQVSKCTDDLSVLQMTCQLQDGINRLNDFFEHEKIDCHLDIVCHSPLRVADVPELQSEQ